MILVGCRLLDNSFALSKLNY